MRHRSPKQMMVIGLTGSIGMGKTTAAKIFHKLGLPIYSADKAVHALLKKNGVAVAQVAKIFPDALKAGAIDRKTLGLSVFHAPKKLRQLERILHPLIRHAEISFLERARKTHTKAAILEIPLLFETQAQKRCDVTICVTAPAYIQKGRVLARPGMTLSKMRTILKRQMADARKRQLADFVVDTRGGMRTTRTQLQHILEELGI